SSGPDRPGRRAWSDSSGPDGPAGRGSRRRWSCRTGPRAEPAYRCPPAERARAPAPAFRAGRRGTGQRAQAGCLGGRTSWNSTIKRRTAPGKSGDRAGKGMLVPRGRYCIRRKPAFDRRAGLVCNVAMTEPASTTRPDTPHARLVAALRENAVLDSIGSTLAWDEQTQLPPAGTDLRANQLSLMARLDHERGTDPRLGELISAAEEAARGLPEDSDEATTAREARRDFDRATKLPASLVEEMARA